METFKLWLTNDEFFGLLEAIDHLEAMAFSTDPEFNRILGVPFPGPQGRGWTKYIVSIVAKNIGKLTAGAYFEDIATSVVSTIMTNISTGGRLAQSVEQAKAVSKTPEELLQNMQGVIMNAAKLRAMDYRRDPIKGSRQRKGQFRMSQFSQYKKGDDERSTIGNAQDHAAGPTDNRDLASYKHMIANELAKMQAHAVSTKQTKLARRLELAQKMLPDRLSGVKMAEIMAKYGLNSKGTVQAVFDDINQALARVAGKLDNPTLIHGMAKQGFAQGG